MIDHSPDLEPRYRAPRAFGPMPGPRNIPASQLDATGLPDEVMTSLSVSLEADPDELARLLPVDTRLRGAAVLTVSVSRFENLIWLAGRGYPILTVTFPVEYLGAGREGGPSAEPLAGRYLAVLWEGMADPVTTGRDELGFPKLPADIRAPRVSDVTADGAATGEALWEGFRFVDLSADNLRPTPAAEVPPPVGTIVHRYVPSLVDPGQADIDQLVYHPTGGTARKVTVTDRLSGTGRFGFHHARFVDSPVQYPVVNALAALSLSATGPATLTRTTGAPGTMPGASAPRVLGSGVARHGGRVPAGAVT